jgi:HD-like signal output (HDOD) protein
METLPKMIRDLLVSQSPDIPIFHGAALKLQQMMGREDFEIEEIVKTVNGDPVLSSKLLQMSNTSFYRGKEQITTVKGAFLRLGAQQVLNILFSISLDGQQSKNNTLNKHMELFWAHSKVVAIASAKLAIELKNTVGINPDEAYMAGLLHDIGKLYLL